MSKMFLLNYNLSELMCKADECLSWIIVLLNILTIFYLVFCSFYKVTKFVRVFGYIWASFVMCATVVILFLHTCIFTILCAVFTGMVIMAVLAVVFQNSQVVEKIVQPQNPQQQNVQQQIIQSQPMQQPVTQVQPQCISQPEVSQQNANLHMSNHVENKNVAAVKPVVQQPVQTENSQPQNAESNNIKVQAQQQEKKWVDEVRKTELSKPIIQQNYNKKLNSGCQIDKFLTK